jgi:multidrug resistance efflux pump
MRTTAGIVLAVVFAAALAMWIRSSSHHMSSTEPAPAEASSTPVLPIELMKKSDKDLPDKTVREPF